MALDFIGFTGSIEWVGTSNEASPYLQTTRPWDDRLIWDDDMPWEPASATQSHDQDSEEVS